MEQENGFIVVIQSHPFEVGSHPLGEQPPRQQIWRFDRFGPAWQLLKSLDDRCFHQPTAQAGNFDEYITSAVIIWSDPFLPPMSSKERVKLPYGSGLPSVKEPAYVLVKKKAFTGFEFLGVPAGVYISLATAIMPIAAFEFLTGWQVPAERRIGSKGNLLLSSTIAELRQGESCWQRQLPRQNIFNRMFKRRHHP